jgi:hypothetical protein
VGAFLKAHIISQDPYDYLDTHDGLLEDAVRTRVREYIQEYEFSNVRNTQAEDIAEYAVMLTVILVIVMGLCMSWAAMPTGLFPRLRAACNDNPQEDHQPNRNRVIAVRG